MPEKSTARAGNPKKTANSGSKLSGSKGVDSAETPRFRAIGDPGNVLFCGIGGQGVLKASEICGVAAMLDGYHVKKSEVHGMAQRGGSVESHLRFGTRVFSPLIAPSTADLLVCFDRAEGERKSGYLKPEGVSFAPFIDLFEKDGADLGGRRFLNTFFLGILSAYLPMDQESWLAALSQVFARAQEQNRTVFLKGAEVGAEALDAVSAS